MISGCLATSKHSRTGETLRPASRQADRGGEIDGDHPPAVLRVVAAEPADDPLPELGGLQQHGEDRADRHDHRQTAGTLLAAATAVTAHISTTLTPHGPRVQPLSRAEGAAPARIRADGRARAPTPRAHARSREAARGRQGLRGMKMPRPALHRDRAGAADAQLRQRRAARPGQGALDRRRLQPDLPPAGQRRQRRAHQRQGRDRRGQVQEGGQPAGRREGGQELRDRGPDVRQRRRALQAARGERASSSRPSRSTRAGCWSTCCSASAR